MADIISKATLGRLPMYLDYLMAIDDEMISAAKIAKDLSLGEVQVRKDLSQICSDGKPKVGYNRLVLKASIEENLCATQLTPTVIVGAGKLGMALYGYDEFGKFGIDIVAAFDVDVCKENTHSKKPIYRMSYLKQYCLEHNVKIGILTVPRIYAQQACDEMVDAGITKIWSFASDKLDVPDNVSVIQENLALSLAYLRMIDNH